MAMHITRAGVALTVGIIIVTGLIIGGFFWARHSSEQARRDEAIKIAQQNLENASKEQTALNSGEGQPNGNASNGTNSENSDANKPVAPNQDQSTANSNNGAHSAADSAPSSGSQEVTQLPATGAGDSITAAVAVGLLTFTGLAYLQSRRKLLESL